MAIFHFSILRLITAAAVRIILPPSVVDGYAPKEGKKGAPALSPTKSPTRLPTNLIELQSNGYMTQPCLMFQSDMGRGSIDDWRCQLSGEDAEKAGSESGDYSTFVTIEGLGTSRGLISGITTIFAKEASIAENLLFIPEGTLVEFSTGFGTSQVDTVDTIKKTIVVHVTATQSETTTSVDELRKNVFGGEDDQYNLKSQMEGCSYNRVKIEKAIGPNINDGVVEIDIQTTEDQLSDYGQLQTLSLNALETLFDTSDLKSVADLILICQPPGSDGWSAYAYFNSPLSFYNDEKCNYPSLQMHEVGHNFNLGHSSQSLYTYGDESGTMGESIFYDEDESQLRCFNAAKSWQLGWFGENSLNLDLVDTDWEGKLVGTGNFQASNDAEKNVLLKIAESHYIQFNYAGGFHASTEEFINRVAIVKQTNDGFYSWVQAALRQGEAYTIEIFGHSPITVEVIKIDTSSFQDAYASVRVYRGDRAACVETCCFETNCGDDSIVFTDKATYIPGETIQVAFANNSPKLYDWIWILNGANVEHGEILNRWDSEEPWIYTCGFQEMSDCTETPTSGVHSFDSSDLQPGVYVAYYLWIDYHEIAVASSPFTVLGDDQTLPPTQAPTPEPVLTIATNKLSYGNNEMIEVPFVNPDSTHYDWVGIYSAEEAVQKYARISADYILWKYSPPGDGSVWFNSSNLDPGTYRSYLLFGDDESVLAQSEEFIITENPVEEPDSEDEEPDSWESIFVEGFETGFGHFPFGGGKAVVENTGIDETFGLRLRGTATANTNWIVISDYTDLKVSLSFRGENTEVDESLLVEIRFNGKPKQWIVVGNWTSHNDFENGNWMKNEEIVEVPTNGKRRVRVRFRGGGIQGNDRFFIDDVEFSGKVKEASKI